MTSRLRNERGTDPLARWESRADQAIREAQEQGAFDNLPGAGKPLKLADNPFGADWDSAFRTLKNAGMAPAWIELDRAIRADEAALTALREGTARYLAEQAARIAPVTHAETDTAPGDAGARGRAGRWLRRLGRRRRSGRHAGPPPSKATDLEAERQRARDRYLARAVELDKKIREYNAAVPRTLWWLERPRLTPHRAAHDFDAACPPMT